MAGWRTILKKPPSKTDLRERLQRQTADFLSAGGKVQEVQSGETAYDRNSPPPTPLTDVIAALEARRAAKRTRTKVVRKRAPKRRRQVIYDDFGEPLRVTWIEE